MADHNGQQDLDVKANVSMRRFYDSLEKRVKRYQPDAYMPYMASLLRKARSDLSKGRYTPPHAVLHSIEANCAFHKSGYAEAVDRSAIAKIMDVYRNHCDLLQGAAVHGHIERFFLMLWREQIELQQVESWQYVSRVWELFVENPKMAPISAILKERHDITCVEWIHLCFLVWAAARLNARATFTRKTILDCRQLTIRESAMDSFLRISSLSPKQVGEHFHKVRSKYPLKYDSLIRSVFIEYPITLFDNGTMISPHEGLLILHSGAGLYRLARPIPEFLGAFSRGFERYVEKMLSYAQNTSRLLMEKDLQKTNSGKTCDFLLDTRDAIVLVECKACMFSANLLSDTAIENDNSSAKIAKALMQLAATARDITNGVYASLSLDATKNVLGVVVTFGDIPMANSPWYFESFLRKRTEQNSADRILPSGRMTESPIVISVDTLENLIRVMNTCGMSLADLCTDRRKQSYSQTGDWDNYLRHILSQYKGQIADLPHVQTSVSKLYQTLGIPENVPR